MLMDKAEPLNSTPGLGETTIDLEKIVRVSGVELVLIGLTN